MYRPSLEEVKKISKDFQVIPLSRELHGDLFTPIGILKILQSVSSHCFLFESVEDTKKWGRYSFIGYNPKMEITCIDGNMTVRGEHEESFQTQNPGAYIQEVMKRYRSCEFEYLPPFTGGLVGYFSYDYIKYSEPSLNLDAKDEENFNDVDLMLFDTIIAFDHLKQKIIFITNIITEKRDDIEEEYQRGISKLDELTELIKNGKSKESNGGHLKSEMKALFSKEEYCQMVEKAKEHIKEGDIFQVVLSNRLEADFEGSLLDTYRVLRTINPSPYMFYLGSDEMELAGASPETLVKLQDGKLFTFPLAGTRPRGDTDEHDQQLEAEMLADPKELSEHNMLVDLGRNDLGKISRFGTVEVESFQSVLRFSHVMHIGSTVTGKIDQNRTSMDAIDAVLPAGTLSGAPKIRACQIINQLEDNKRGIYGGAIGYIDFKGNMDTCIAIRLVFKKNGKVFIRSGAGIVAESVPEIEYEECINKAKAVMKALETAERGIDQ